MLRNRLVFCLMTAGSLLLTGCPGDQPFAPVLGPDIQATGTPVPEASPTSTPSPEATASPRGDAGLQLQYGQMPPNTWLAAAPLVHGRGGVSAGAVSGTLFAIGGDSEATVEIYDAAQDAWRLSYLPPQGWNAPWTRARHFGAAVSSHGRIFYIGGSHNWVDDHVDVYHPETHQWLDAQDRNASSPWFQRTGMAAVASDGLITLLGGEMASESALDGMAPSDSVVAFYPDVTTGWSELYNLAPLPTPRAGLGAAVIDQRLFVVGGYSQKALTGSPTATGSMLRYRTNSWASTTPAGSPLASLNTPRHSFGSAVLDGKWYVAGGVDSEGRVLDSVEVYDPVQNVWTELTPMPTARAHLALAPLNGRLFALGGYDATGRTLRGVDVYRP